MLSRRQFVVWVSSAIPVALVSRRADAVAAGWIAADADVLRALAEAILPTELGREGAARIARDFQRWVDDYRANAELVHGYGTSALRFAPASPRAKWAAQLTRLGDLAAMSVDARRARVRDAVKGLQESSLPEVAAAPHVAVALLSFYFTSSAAADLCHEARIGREQCRPLAAQARKPLPLAGVGP